MVEWTASLTQWTWAVTALGNNEGQGSLGCCSPWDLKESDMTEWINYQHWEPINKQFLKLKPKHQCLEVFWLFLLLGIPVQLSTQTLIVTRVVTRRLLLPFILPVLLSIFNLPLSLLKTCFWSGKIEPHLGLVSLPRPYANEPPPSDQCTAFSAKGQY